MGQATQAAFDARIDIDLGSMSDNARAVSTNVAGAEIRLSIHEELAGIEQDWRAFEQHADCTAFQSFEWLSTWQRHIGARSGTMPAVVCGRDTAGTLVFMFPFAVEPRGFLRQLTWLGSGLCDYNAPLLAPNFSQLIGAARFMQVWREIMARLQSHPRLGYDLVSFEKMPERLGTQANPFLQIGVSSNPNSAYLTQLRGDWEAFYNEKRSSATRRRDRTKRKKLAGIGEVRFVNPDTADIGAALDTFFVQKAQSFAHMGVTNLFVQPGYREFYRDLATNAATRHLVHVSRLDVGATHAAINLGLMFRGCYYHVLASYDGGEVSKYGPGAAHLHELMRYAIDNKCNAFDFTIGGERYKTDWSDTELKLFDHVAAAKLRGWPVAITIAVLSRLKRWIKQTPVVWDAVFKARAFVASLKGRGG